MSNNDVVVKQQDEIQVFENENGEICIAQNWGLTDEQFVWFNVENAEIVAQAIIDVHAKIMRGE